MRGKETSTIGIRLPAGITPACAGKSASHGFFVLLRWDHPRVCGEKSYWSILARNSLGSPPRVRGKAVFPARQHRTAGITPACAGKRRLASPGKKSHGDHPRVCGEKSRHTLSWDILLGSPPRVRGKVLHVVTLFDGAGITPACAGKSCPPQAPTFTRQDHPRLCGEKSGPGAKKKQQVGSPPRMRGKGTGGDDGTGHHGITPACAGKSCPPQAPTFTRQDHPRLCGEKFHPASDRKLGRVRGTKRSSGPAPAAAPAGLAGSYPASPPWSYPPRITVSRPRP